MQLYSQMKPLDPYIQGHLVILNRNHTLQQAVRAWCKNQVSCILVGDENGEALGILTPHDLVCRGGFDPDQQSLPLAQVMSYPLASVEESDSIASVIHLMCRLRLKRIPILSEDPQGRSRFVGLVTLEDLILDDQITLAQIRRLITERVSLDHSSSESFTSLTLLDDYRQEHYTQSLHHFYEHLQKFTCLERDRLPSLVELILTSLCRRVSLSCAQHFMAQLPFLLRQRLSALPAGPDRECSGKRLIQEISQVHHFSLEDSCSVLMRVLEGLADLMGRGSLVHLRQELPREYFPFFDWALSAQMKCGASTLALTSKKGRGVRSLSAFRGKYEGMGDE